MTFAMKVTLSLSKELEDTSKLAGWFEEANSDLLTRGGGEDEGASVVLDGVSGQSMDMTITSGRRVRPHHALQRLRKFLAGNLGMEYKIGIRGADVLTYSATFPLEKAVKTGFSVPFLSSPIEARDAGEVTVEFKVTGDEGDLDIVTLEALNQNIPDRVIKRILDKVEEQHYEGKGEFWELVWKSEEKEVVYSGDPTDDMVKQGWVVQGPTKGKWFLRPQATAVMRAMERIALEEVLIPLGFQEVISSHIVGFDVWKKTGHLEGMPGEIYYVSEPATRDPAAWEEFRDWLKITKEVPDHLLKDLIQIPRAGISYAQCPNIYWSFSGRTLADTTLPVKIFERAANSNRYESGGRHGLERVDEFHRIEPVYIGTAEQLGKLKDDFVVRYKHVFNDILELEWRMAWVTPFYMAQAGQVGVEDNEEKVKGTMDFEAYMPYRGDRDSEWLEFQNLSVLGDKYIQAFNIKAQKETIWSGCSGIGLERWMTSFLSQKGLDPDDWPEGFKKYLPRLPPGIDFV